MNCDCGCHKGAPGPCGCCPRKGVVPGNGRLRNLLARSRARLQKLRRRAALQRDVIVAIEEDSIRVKEALVKAKVREAKLQDELADVEKRTQSPVAGSDCGAGNYFDELKCHGCIEIPCEHCGEPYCSHWPYCPRCILQRFRDVEKRRAQFRDLLDQAADELDRWKPRVYPGDEHETSLVADMIRAALKETQVNP